MQQTALCQMSKQTALRMLCILVHDLKKHNVCYSQMGGCWLLENAVDGLVSTHDTFSDAITGLTVAVGPHGSGYDWTVIENPYYCGD